MSATINDLPYEVLENIFINATGATIVKCRLVCKTWKEFIDVNEILWQGICLKEHHYASKIAKKKCGNDLSWRDLYRNLHLWPNAIKSNGNIQEFCSFNEYYGSLAIDKGLLFLRESDRMVLYDMLTLKNIPIIIPGHCRKISNSENTTAILTHSTLYLQRDKIHEGMEIEAQFKAHKFVLTDNDLYFYRASHGIFRCNLKLQKLKAVLLFEYVNSVLEMDVSNGVLFVFTHCGEILKFIRNVCFMKTIDCPDNWLRNIRYVQAFNEDNFICYSKNIFYLETKKYKHVSLDFPPITALFFYGDIVIIGTDGGEILLFMLSKQKKSTKPLFDVITKLPEGNFALSLDVYEKQTGPVIVATTLHNITLIEFLFNPEYRLAKKPELSYRVPMYKRLLKLRDRVKPHED